MRMCWYLQCAGTYSVRIDPTQRPQRFFENYHYRMTAKAGKGLSALQFPGAHAHHSVEYKVHKVSCDS